MRLLDAYTQALDEDDDPAEREEFTSSAELKIIVIEEIMSAIKEVSEAKTSLKSPADTVKPLFSCVAFFFIIGIRVGKILRDAELAGE